MKKWWMALGTVLALSIGDRPWRRAQTRQSERVQSGWRGLLLLRQVLSEVTSRVHGWMRASALRSSGI